MECVLNRICHGLTIKRPLLCNIAIKIFLKTNDLNTVKISIDATNLQNVQSLEELGYRFLNLAFKLLYRNHKSQVVILEN